MFYCCLHKTEDCLPFIISVLRVQSYSIDKPSSLNDISVIELESRERREAVNNDTTTQSAGQQTTEATSLRPPRPTATTDGPQRPAPTSPRPPFPEDWNVQHVSFLTYDAFYTQTYCIGQDNRYQINCSLISGQKT